VENGNRSADAIVKNALNVGIIAIHQHSIIPVLKYIFKFLSFNLLYSVCIAIALPAAKFAKQTSDV
jgi:hypothetical protein